MYLEKSKSGRPLRSLVVKDFEVNFYDKARGQTGPKKRKTVETPSFPFHYEP